MPTAQVNGISMYYRERGEGEPLVMVQGFGGGHEGWFFQARAFGEHFRVIVFDNRGIGRTERSPKPYTIDTMAEDTIGLMDALGVARAHVLGMSLGGIVAQEVAIKHPDRVMKLVLVCTHMGEGEMSDVRPDMLKALGMEEGSTEPNLRNVDMGDAMGTIVSLAFSKRLYRMVLVPLAKYQMKRIGPAAYLEQLEAVVGHTTAERLGQVQSRTLVITGSDDRIVSPRSSQEIARRIPDARLVMVEGGSHAFNVEMRKTFNREVVGFLRGE
jgi:pimeloyl-ACP methyl ester carboxylesterase